MQGGVGRGIKSIRFRTFHRPQTFNVESDQDKMIGSSLENQR